jgi:glycogen(starch) synthase
VARLGRDVEVVVGGDGAALPELRSLAARLGIGDRVHLPGRLDRREVSGAVAAADVLVVPSRVEAFGIVALEAWRGGTPLVMTSLGGATDFVTDGVDGILVDPTDVEALGTAIGRVLADPALARSLAAAGRRTVGDYGWDRVVGDYEAVYETVTSAPG